MYLICLLITHSKKLGKSINLETITITVPCLKLSRGLVEAVRGKLEEV